MEGMLEIRWHGRGGQGSKTASILLAKIAAAAGNNVQAFPEYGPERMGAPVLAYTRISSDSIHLHCQIENPGLVVILDSTLVGTVDISAGLDKNGALLLNSEEAPENLNKELGLSEGTSIYTVDADNISQESIGRIFPNTPMLGAINRVIDWLDYNTFQELAARELKKKFSHNQEIVNGNLKAIERAYQEVQGI
ncbi:MAG TPA: 2-oxoacid:acceptor oxidoreductase family protein [Halanaerobiales bacterium]|nr:2-oxoacid:acceptor oxidoreductase family protein [Halanaerobiales bacterium]